MYVYYGERIINQVLQKETGQNLSEDDLRLCYHHIYKNFIQEIDAIDNGVSICPDGVKPQYHVNTHLSHRLSLLNPSWQETEVDIPARFQAAMNLAGTEFVQNVVRTATVWLKARDFVRQALLDAKEKNPTPEIIVLKQYCPWIQHLFELEKEYDLVGIPKMVIFPDSSSENTWRVQGVPLAPQDFKGRKFFPELWRGRCNEELSTLAGIKDLIFVHHSGFIGGAKSFESALEMANKSNNWSN